MFYQLPNTPVVPELNCFLEYDMATSIRFSTYFGFSDDEIDVLFEKYKKLTDTPYITREDLKQWYEWLPLYCRWMSDL